MARGTAGAPFNIADALDNPASQVFPFDENLGVFLIGIILDEVLQSELAKVLLLICVDDRTDADVTDFFQRHGRHTHVSYLLVRVGLKEAVCGFILRQGGERNSGSELSLMANS